MAAVINWGIILSFTVTTALFLKIETEMETPLQKVVEIVSI